MDNDTMIDVLCRLDTAEMALADALRVAEATSIDARDAIAVMNKAEALGSIDLALSRVRRLQEGYKQRLGLDCIPLRHWALSIP